MDLNKKFWQWALLLVLAMIWGSSFILMKKGLRTFSNTQVAGLRIFFSFLLFIPLIIRSFHKFSRKNIWHLAVVGLVGNFFPAFLFTKAQTQISSSLAGMLNSCTPIFTLVIAMLFYKNRFKLINILGLVLGLLGAFNLVYQGPQSIYAEKIWYPVFVVIATICYAVSVNIVKNNLRSLDGVSIAALSFFFIGPLAAGSLFFTNLSLSFQSPGFSGSLLAIFILALFSSVIAIIFFNILIKYTTAVFAASVTYIIPVFAIFWGIFDGENISLEHLMWILVILIGVYLVNKKKLISL